MNKFQWNLNQSTNIYIKENAFEIAVGKMAAILSRFWYVRDAVDRQQN